MRVRQITVGKARLAVAEDGTVWAYDAGRVVRLRQYRDPAGYATVSRFGTRIVHRLLLTAFDRAPNGKEYVNHKNGDKTDNRLENLEWVTPAQNNAHARATGLWGTRKRAGLAKARASIQKIWTHQSPKLGRPKTK